MASYTKPQNLEKGFYALCRGFFPVQELCGFLTALQLSRRDVLGLDLSLFKILFPAVFIHGLATFKGMKPIFKWNSAMPWSEMQLSPPLGVGGGGAGLESFEMLNKGLGKVVWGWILLRICGYCVKNFFLINRQAKKKATTYLGNEDGFMAELGVGELLKKEKKK